MIDKNHQTHRSPICAGLQADLTAMNYPHIGGYSRARRLIDSHSP
jgi:hypothetical protein